MTTQQGLRGWIGHDLVDEEGHKIGRIDDLYADEMTGKPEWLAVKTGWFGGHISFVPLSQLQSSDEYLVSPWSKDRIKDAPHIDAEQHLTIDEERTLYRHYGMNYAAQQASTGRGDTMGRPDQGMNTGNVPGMGAGGSGQPKLRRWVETDQQNVTVPVRKERVEVVRDDERNTGR
jgi:hypothetical protein